MTAFWPEQHHNVLGCIEYMTILTDVRGVCLSVCLLHGLNRRRHVQCTPGAVCAGSFGAVFVKLL